MSEQIKPVAWWNGLRKEDYEDLTGPSISWNGETDSHDIPLFAGFNEASETVQRLQQRNDRLLAALKVAVSSVDNYATKGRIGCVMTSRKLSEIKDIIEEAEKQA